MSHQICAIKKAIRPLFADRVTNNIAITDHLYFYSTAWSSKIVSNYSIQMPSAISVIGHSNFPHKFPIKKPCTKRTRSVHYGSFLNLWWSQTACVCYWNIHCHALIGWNIIYYILRKSTFLFNGCLSKSLHR